MKHDVLPWEIDEILEDEPLVVPRVKVKPSYPVWMHTVDGVILLKSPYELELFVTGCEV